jgi:N,N'-diacetyllegionaminate synthase
MKCFIIAEAGVNHNGSIEIAKKLVDAAVHAGADCIKFQTFKAKNLVTKTAEKAAYQNKQISQKESQLSMLQRLELSYIEFTEIASYCKEKGIVFLSTPFDHESIDFLDQMGIEKWKIPSGEITNYPYLVKIAQTHKPIILSTGMSTVHEIEDAVKVLQTKGAGPITLLHCTTEYPAPYDEVNLNALVTLMNIFKLPVGYSDHTQGITIPIAAVAMGAVVIEKHFTLDRNMEGPDHKASLEPDELKAMVEAIRCVEVSMGDGVKKPTKSELKNLAIARKSIVARKPIRVGEKFTEENIAAKRPGTGISPMQWNEVIGQCSKRSFDEDELIEL